MQVVPIGPDVPTQATGWPVGLAVASLAVAGVLLLVGRLVRHPLLHVGFVVLVTAGAAFLIRLIWPAPVNALQETARTCGPLAFFWAVLAAWLTRHGDPTSPGAPVAGWGVGRAAGLAALLLGVVTAIIQSVVLAMRAIFVAIESINGYPARVPVPYGFGQTGAWSLIFLFGACAVALWSMRNRRLATCTVCSAAMLASWVCLLAPAVRPMPAGGYERTGSTILLLIILSTLVLLTAVLIRAFDGVKVDQGQSGGRAEPRAWPGMTAAVAVIVLTVVMLVCYHLAVPIPLRPGGFRLTALLATTPAAITAVACFLIVNRWWCAYLADAAMVLASLTLCGLATLVVPSTPDALAERYPLVFNAMIVGLAAATGLWTALASIWQRRAAGDDRWTTTAALIPYARRFAFFSAALALVIGALMALWPRWPTVSATDDTLGRVTAGVAANLFLLLVMLWCSRRLHKMTFQILTVLVVVSTTGFLLARMLPFTPRFG